MSNFNVTQSHGITANMPELLSNDNQSGGFEAIQRRFPFITKMLMLFGSFSLAIVVIVRAFALALVGSIGAGGLMFFAVVLSREFAPNLEGWIYVVGCTAWLFFSAELIALVAAFKSGLALVPALLFWPSRHSAAPIRAVCIVLSLLTALCCVGVLLVWEFSSICQLWNYDMSPLAGEPGWCWSGLKVAVCILEVVGLLIGFGYQIEMFGALGDLPQGSSTEQPDQGIS